MKLKNIGASKYLGQDFDGAELRAAPGQEFKVTERRAQQLFKDYPGRFQLVGEAVTLPPGIYAPEELSREFVNVTRDPADTSSSGGSVPVVTVSAGTGEAPEPPKPAAPLAPEPPPAAPSRRGRRRRGQPS